MKKFWIAAQMLAIDVALFFPAHYIYDMIGFH